MDRSQPMSLKPTMIGRKLRSVNWHGALKQKGVKQTGVKQGRVVYKSCLMCCVGAKLRE